MIDILRTKHARMVNHLMSIRFDGEEGLREDAPDMEAILAISLEDTDVFDHAARVASRIAREKPFRDNNERTALALADLITVFDHAPVDFTGLEPTTIRLLLKNPDRFASWMRDHRKTTKD